jgi:hypothetical protein
VQPARDGSTVTDRARPSGEQKESGLKRILGVLIVAEHLPADAPDERSVTANEFGERGPIPARDESREEFRVAIGRSPDGVERAEERREWAAGH